jgi:hypothetical protein
MSINPAAASLAIPAVAVVVLVLAVLLTDEQRDECGSRPGVIVECEPDCALSVAVVDAYEGRPSIYPSVSKQDYETALQFLKVCPASVIAPTPPAGISLP